MNIILGLLGIIFGFSMVKYTAELRPLFGTWNWAEQVFSTGGTYTAMKLVGVGVMIVSFIYMTGTLDFLTSQFFSRQVPVKIGSLI